MSLLLFFGGPFDGPFIATAAMTQDGQAMDASAVTLASGTLGTTIPAYPYMQYADDANIVAYFTAYNQVAQQYLDWFNLTPLGLYTLATINGPLLDWIGEGLYGLSRPTFASSSSSYRAGLNALPVNTIAVNEYLATASGTATLATDDYYKRCLTWQTYAGNGRYTNTSLLRLRIARFLYGANGSDVTLSLAQNVHIAEGALPPPPAPVLSSVSGGTFGARTYGVQATYVTPLGETVAGQIAALTVAANHLLVVDSPPYQNGAIKWNVYATVLSTLPGSYLAGVNAQAVNLSPVNGSNALGLSPPTEQNSTPIALGTNWTEPSSGLIAGDQLPSGDTSNPAPNILITVPASLAASAIFQQAMNQGILAFPLMLTPTVILR